MPDPAVSPAVGAAVMYAAAAAALGPMLGPVMLVTIMSSLGAFIAAAESETFGVRHVFVFVLRGSLFALALAFLAAEWVEQRFGLAGHSILCGFAVLIGYRAHRLGDLLLIARAIQAAVTKGGSDRGRH